MKITPSITINVYLKQIGKKWFCYQTLKGYDYSFDSETEAEAIEQMKDQIRKLYSSSGRLEINVKKLVIN